MLLNLTSRLNLCLVSILFIEMSKFYDTPFYINPISPLIGFNTYSFRENCIIFFKLLSSFYYTFQLFFFNKFPFLYIFVSLVYQFSNCFRFCGLFQKQIIPHPFIIIVVYVIEMYYNTQYTPLISYSQYICILLDELIINLQRYTIINTIYFQVQVQVKTNIILLAQTHTHVFGLGIGSLLIQTIV